MTRSDKPSTSHSPQVTPPAMSQAQRDKPFQQRLSAILQAEDKTRAGQIARSQDRQASTKRKPTN
jgi:hypothetical protein